MKIQFIGVGSAFTLPTPDDDGSVDFNKCDWQSNILVHSDSEKKLLIDCGGDVRFSLTQAGYKAADIDAVYISHLHADHTGGLEWLSFSTFFAPNVPKPKLSCNKQLMPQLWEQTLRGGLESVQGQMMNLTSYYDCVSIPENGNFRWEGINFVPVQTVHVMSGYTIKYSYGLLIHESEKSGDTTTDSNKSNPVIFLTTDTQFCPNQINDFYARADHVFQDCETGFRSGVHAHYDDLCTLDDQVRKKMWLYHYQPSPTQNAVEDGFGGFVQKGQVFEF